MGKVSLLDKEFDFTVSAYFCFDILFSFSFCLQKRFCFNHDFSMDFIYRSKFEIDVLEMSAM